MVRRFDYIYLTMRRTKVKEKKLQSEKQSGKMSAMTFQSMRKMITNERKLSPLQSDWLSISLIKPVDCKPS